VTINGCKWADIGFIAPPKDGFHRTFSFGSRLDAHCIDSSNRSLDGFWQKKVMETCVIARLRAIIRPFGVFFRAIQQGCDDMIVLLVVSVRVAWMHEDAHGESWIPHIDVADADSIELRI